MYKIVIFGSNGQLGKELVRKFSNKFEVIKYCRNDVDFNDFVKLEKIIKLNHPDIILNAAAFTDVDGSEENRDTALRVNHLAPGIIAKSASLINALVVHYSTDYVFSGDKIDAYNEADLTGPKNFYGKSKLMGENEISLNTSKFLILRTSWLMSDENKNFLKTIFNLAKKKSTLEVVDDQFSSPTSVTCLSDITYKLINIYITNKLNSKLFGIYHVSSEGKVNWHEYAKYIVNEMNRLGIDTKLKAINIVPINSKKLNAVAPRPSNSYLNTSLISKVIDKELPNWKHEVTHVLMTLKSKHE